MSSEAVLVARQPIYDQRVRVVAYEILYRTAQHDRAQIEDGDAATASVSVNAVLDIGLDALVGRSRAYLNVTRNVLVQHLYDFLPADRVVLEVLEDIQPERKVIDSLARAKARGYTIAIDDYAGDERLAPLVELADVIKLDMPRLDDEQVQHLSKHLARPGRRLLAEKVETHATFERCRELGFDLFQGYFFAQPQLVRSQRMPADRVALMRLLTRVQDPAADIEEIEQLVASNVTLSYKLLRYVNSALLGVTTNIESIHHAIVMLGLERVRTAATMLVLAGVSDKPHELVVTALVRARYCQLLATLRRREAGHQYFTAGLLSVLDAFMDRPMQELLEELHIAPELEAALLRREGALGEVLDAAVACERADWPRLLSTGFDIDALRTAYVQALDWVADTDSAISAQPS